MVVLELWVAEATFFVWKQVKSVINTLKLKLKISWQSSIILVISESMLMLGNEEVSLKDCRCSIV